jgi:hypothetical protein
VDDENDINVSLVTWNLAEESPSEEESSFMKRFRGTSKVQSFPKGESGTRRRDSERTSGDKAYGGSDLVLISAQECENIKPRRTEGRRSREYRRLMIRMLGKDYVPLAIHLLGGIQCGLFCKRKMLDDIEFVSIADVTCGIGNVFHNKGGIGAFVQIKARRPSLNDSKVGANSSARAKSIKMLFVTAHMAAHVHNSGARDSDFWRIMSELEAQAPDNFLDVQEQATQIEETSQKAGTQLLESMDYVFFCGDLNYRLDLPRESVELSVSKIIKLQQSIKNSRDMNVRSRTKSELMSVVQQLLKHDQLKTSIVEGRAFPGFAEGCITFPPTFKYDKHTDHYDTSPKQRIPAWTDRILFKSPTFVGSKKTRMIRVLEYDSVQTATHSDHRPVFGTFRISTTGRIIQQTLSKNNRSKNMALKDKQRAVKTISKPMLSSKGSNSAKASKTTSSSTVKGKPTKKKKKKIAKKVLKLVERGG